MLSVKSIKLCDKHLIEEPAPRDEVARLSHRFTEQWMMLDRLLIVNDDYINQLRSNEKTANTHILNGVVISEQQADRIHPKIGDMHRDMEARAKADWEVQFEKSQNWLRLTTLAQSYLMWEEHLREKYLDLINFDDQSITIKKEIATVRADIFGDLAKIRNSMWHASSNSDQLGICLFENSEFKELTKYSLFEKDQELIISASELPEIGNHLFGVLGGFPNGFTLGTDNKKVSKLKKSSK